MRRPDLEPGGWAFEFDNDHYPDIDDTAEVVLALRRVHHPEPDRMEAAIRRGVDWTLGMQSRNGGWGAFDADNVRAYVPRDPVLRLRRGHRRSQRRRLRPRARDAGRRGAHRRTRDASRDRLSPRRAGGPMAPGSAAGESTTCTARARRSPASSTAACRAPTPACAGPRRGSRSIQNPDGGWGEDGRSYEDEAWIGRGPSTASQTAWALLALHAVGDALRPWIAVWRGW